MIIFTKFDTCITFLFLEPFELLIMVVDLWFIPSQNYSNMCKLAYSNIVKTWFIYILRKYPVLISAVCLSYRSIAVICHKCFTFSSSSPEPLGQYFNKFWHKASLVEGYLSWIKWRATPLSNKIAEIHRWNLKIFCSRLIDPISTKLGTKKPWVKEISKGKKYNKILKIID